MPLTQTSLQGVWLKALLITLFGYALMGKGFAYLFVGELVLVLGFFIFLQSLRVMVVFSDSVLLLWAMFATWGICRTVPFISQYHFDALRDAVLWGYGTFALLIAAFVNKSYQISRALNCYRKFLRWYLPILPVVVYLSGLFRDILPTLPWAPGVSIIMLKTADAAVHLAGAALFLLIFPDRRAGSQKQGVSIYRLIGFAGWSLSTLLVLVLSRGGFMAMIIPIILVSILKAQKIGWKVAALAITTILGALMVLETNVVTITHHGRTFTPDQILENVVSIVGGNQTADLQDSKAWRLVWWQHIVQYTIFGPYFWTGKGFGVNLTLQDGPPGAVTKEEVALRSPHNGNMTVLARTGVPGAIIWAALNLVFAFRLLKAYRLAIRSESRFWSGVNLWILCYWLSAFINMSFDVDIEGPQGGIWFWSIIGFGVAALRVQAYEAHQIQAQARIEAAQTPDPEYPAVHA
jgi:hypothetical protein